MVPEDSSWFLSEQASLPPQHATPPAQAGSGSQELTNHQHQYQHQQPAGTIRASDVGQQAAPARHQRPIKLLTVVLARPPLTEEEATYKKGLGGGYQNVPLCEHHTCMHLSGHHWVTGTRNDAGLQMDWTLRLLHAQYF